MLMLENGAKLFNSYLQNPNIYYTIFHVDSLIPV